MDVVEYLDVHTRRDARRVVLDGERLAIGRSDANDLALTDDPSVSRAHVMLERLPAGWVIRDLGSRNGTLVNGRKLWADHVLHAGDRIQIGSAQLAFGRAPSESYDRTAGPETAPDLTRREREVLVELCRPAMSGDVFTEPASIRQIAEALYVSDAAVKQHLTNLYDKFRIHPDAERRRVLLANEAVRRGVVTIADLEVVIEIPDAGSRTSTQPFDSGSLRSGEPLT
jgi:ATP/maltotriose-dependent transcriptional regulator MalT